MEEQPEEELLNIEESPTIFIYPSKKSLSIALACPTEIKILTNETGTDPTSIHHGNKTSIRPK